MVCIYSCKKINKIISFTLCSFLTDTENTSSVFSALLELSGIVFQYGLSHNIIIFFCLHALHLRCHLNSSEQISLVYFFPYRFWKLSITWRRIRACYNACKSWQIIQNMEYLLRDCSRVMNPTFIFLLVMRIMGDSAGHSWYFLGDQTCTLLLFHRSPVMTQHFREGSDLRCIRMNKSSFCLYGKRLLKVQKNDMLEKNPLLISLAGIVTIFSRWIVFRHSSDAIVSCPAALGRVLSGGVRGHQPFDMQALGGPQLTASFLTRSKHFPARKLLCDYPGFCNPHHTKLSLEVPHELWLSHTVNMILLLFMTFPKTWVSAHPENYLKGYTYSESLWKMHLPLYASRHIAGHFC